MTHEYMSNISKSIEIKAPVDTVFTYFARPEHVSDQMSDKGVGMTVIPMDIKEGMGVGTTFRIIGDFGGKRLEWDCETTEFVREEKISAIFMYRLRTEAPSIFETLSATWMAFLRFGTYWYIFVASSRVIIFGTILLSASGTPANP